MFPVSGAARTSGWRCGRSWAAARVMHTSRRAPLDWRLCSGPSTAAPVPALPGTVRSSPDRPACRPLLVERASKAIPCHLLMERCKCSRADIASCTLFASMYPLSLATSNSAPCASSIIAACSDTKELARSRQQNNVALRVAIAGHRIQLLHPLVAWQYTCIYGLG
jgi:hypothetical protein